MQILECFTDGSSHGNGKPHCTGGWSFVTWIENRLVVRYGHLPAPSSNNKGEIAGVLYGVHKFGDIPGLQLDFYSDSQYVVKSINEWRHKHKTSNYAGIKNPEMLIPLYTKWDSCSAKCQISWVKGHESFQGLKTRFPNMDLEKIKRIHKGNEAADEYCGLGSANKDRSINNEFADIKMVSHLELQIYMRK
jgi:ribonuclease HI